jgi:hypothetical protein
MKGAKGQEDTHMSEENKALSRRFIEGYVRGDTDIVDELLAPHFVFHILPAQPEKCVLRT